VTFIYIVSVMVVAMLFGIMVSIMIDVEIEIRKVNQSLARIDTKLMEDQEFQKKIEERSGSSQVGTILDIRV